MTSVFAVIRRRGPAWRADRPMEEQPGWRPHADFMNALAAEGFCLLVGPLEGSGEILLVARADGADAVAERLAEDPWTRNDLLETVWIRPWELRIGNAG